MTNKVVDCIEKSTIHTTKYIYRLNSVVVKNNWIIRLNWMRLKLDTYSILLTQNRQFCKDDSGSFFFLINIMKNIVKKRNDKKHFK